MHSPSAIECENVQWPKSSVDVVPAGRLYMQRSSHTPEKIRVEKCTAVVPFIRVLVAPHQLGPEGTRQLLHINETQVDAAMNIFRLFSDECKCTGCKATVQREEYKLNVYPGARVY